MPQTQDPGDIVSKCADAILARVENTRPRSLDRDMLIEEVGKAFAAWSDLERRVSALENRIVALEARLAPEWDRWRRRLLGKPDPK
jgi:hypothetical protein